VSQQRVIRKCFCAYFEHSEYHSRYWVRNKKGLEPESGFVKIKPGRSSGPMAVELIFQTENIEAVQERKEGTELCQDKVGLRYNDQKRHERTGSLDNYCYTITSIHKLIGYV